MSNRAEDCGARVNSELRIGLAVGEPPNMRVKLAAPTSKGIQLFVKTTTLRRSLRAFR